MKKYFYKENIIRLCILLAVPIIILFCVRFYNLAFLFSCPYKTHFGVLCPGCGMTRAIFELTKLDFLKSVLYNPAALILAVFGALFYAEQWLKFFGGSGRLVPRNKWIYIIAAGTFVIYCVLRNFAAFSFLSIA